MASSDGSNLRTVSTVESVFTHPRWSPDGASVAATELGFRTLRRLAIISVADGTVRMLATPLARRRLSAPAWLADLRVVDAQAESVTADTAGSSARIYAHDLQRDTTRMLLWSPSRRGHFEIWTANFDGSEARQITQDGVDAENPTAAPDGWVVYSSGNPAHGGIWKVRIDGTNATQIVATDVLAPDVSPDGELVAATIQPGRTSQVRIQVFRVKDGSQVPFEIVLPSRELTFGIGRTPWMPDGKRLAFLGLDARGVRGIYVQDFVPGRDSTATRRPLAAFDPDTRTESFAISPDGAVLVATGNEQLRTILRADGLPGLRRPVPQR